MTTAGRSAFAAAHRMVNRIHGHAAHRGLTPHPATATGFADRNCIMFNIADLTDRGEDKFSFTNRTSLDGILQVSKLALFNHQLNHRAGRASHLGASARLQFHIVNERARRNLANRHRIADLDFDILARHNLSRQPSTHRER